MKPVIFLCIVTLFFADSKAQRYMSGSYPGTSFRNYSGMNFNYGDSLSPKKWPLNKYSGISTSFIGWKGGHATAFSVPFGLQLNRRINNNLYAFAGLSVAPTYLNFNQAFLNTGLNNKSFPGSSFMYRPNSFGINPRAELGLMYTNDERTFQISGSVGMERRTFPDARDFQRLNNPNTVPVNKR